MAEQPRGDESGERRPASGDERAKRRRPKQRKGKRRRGSAAVGAPIGAAAAVAGRHLADGGASTALHHQGAVGAGEQAAGALAHRATDAAGALGHRATDVAAPQAAAPGGGPSTPPPQPAVAQIAAVVGVAVAVVAAVVAALTLGGDPDPEAAEPPPPTTAPPADPFVAPSNVSGGFVTGASQPLAGNILEGVDPGSAIEPLMVTGVSGSPGDVGAPVVLPSGATITVRADGSFDYDPGEAHQSVPGGQTATDQVVVTVADQGGWSAEWTIEVSVTGANGPPSIAPIAEQQVLESTTATIDVTATDPDADTLSFALAEGSPAFATIEETGDGGATLSLAPSAGDAGAYTVTIVVTDDGAPAQSTEATVTVTVTASQPRPLRRVTGGLLALYEFGEGSGDLVADSAGAGSSPALTIADLEAVTWSDGALRIDRPTTVASQGPADRLQAAILASNELTMEAWLTPANATQGGPARVVSLSSGVLLRNATLGQGSFVGGSGDHWSARVRTTTTGENGLPVLSTPAATITSDRLVHVVLTRSAAGEMVIYVDGQAVATAPSAGDLSNWDGGFRLLLANETSGDRPWLGTYHLVAVYGRALSSAEVNQNLRVGP